MALFIAQTDGTTNFDVGQAQLDLIDISKIDSGVGFDETNTVSRDGVTLVPVSYARIESGACPERLDDLVNEISYTAPPDIVVFAVDDTFTLSDGTPVKGNGFALEVTDTANPFSNDVCTFYDITLCGGDGIWVDKEGGGKTYLTTSVMLYHELSHCFHFVTGTTASTSADEEKNAEIDENDMRDQKSIDHRDVDSHNGGCGAVVSGCCVVASLSTGSAYSEQVERLRNVRAGIFSDSEVGNEFFKQLHYNYYAFSPEVCGLMANNESMQLMIKNYFVTPLILGLEVIVHYSECKSKDADFAGLIKRQNQMIQVLNEGGLTSYLKKLSCIFELSSQNKFSAGNDVLNEILKVENISRLFEYINIVTIKDEYIMWALVEVAGLWVNSSKLLLEGIEEGKLNRIIYERISKWISRMPISSIWSEYSELKTKEELNRLSQYIFDKEAKTIFAKRLTEKYPALLAAINNWAIN